MALWLACVAPVAAFRAVLPGRPLAALRVRSSQPLRVAAPEAVGLPPLKEGEEFRGIDECPFTLWGPRDVRLTEERKAPSSYEFAPEFHKKDVLSADATLEEELDYFRSLKPTIKPMLHKHGAVILRGFEITKTSDGFQRFYLALGLDPCDDPLQSVAARDAVDKSKGVYEAVNKESRSKYFVGMHNEQVGIRSPARAAFVCFKPADEGGEFLILDGRKMFREIEPEFLEELYDKQVRFIAAEIPLGFMENLPGFLRSALEPPLLAFATTMAKSKVDFDIDLVWDEDNEGKPCIHAIAPLQTPVVRHPDTNEPVWFCNIHSHSDYLRQQREARDGTLDLSETTGSSRLNRTDIRFGDLSAMSRRALEAFDALVMKNLKWVAMQKGDVVLLDNYMTMHGRNIFSGVRKHAVTWFK